MFSENEKKCFENVSKSLQNLAKNTSGNTISIKEPKPVSKKIANRLGRPASPQTPLAWIELCRRLSLD